MVLELLGRGAGARKCQWSSALGIGRQNHDDLTDCLFGDRFEAGRIDGGGR